MMSVARRIASTALSLQPYLLSNLLLVTLSFTLMAGIGRVPAFSRSRRRNTPVVVSSLSPRMPLISSGYLSKTMLVRSPPSSRIMFRGSPSGKANKVCSMHQSNSSLFMPFQAYTGIPAAAMAAAAWSCVLKMLQLLQLTSAPSSFKVSISTAVWIVMCRQPATRAPFSGLSLPYCSRRAMRPGISASASWISFRPQSASAISFTLYLSCSLVWGMVVFIGRQR